MSTAASLSGTSLASAHQQFEAALPAIDPTVRFVTITTLPLGLRCN